MSVIKHVAIHTACNKPAFIVDHKPDPYESILSGVTMLDGTIALRGMPILCGSCGEHLIKDEIGCLCDIRLEAGE